MEIILASVITAVLTAIGSYLLQKDKFKNELELFYGKIKLEFDMDIERVRTMFMAEQVAKRLLESENWEKRTFVCIQERLGGFDDEELRRILVRAGAVRFTGKDGQEFWGLIERNKASV